MWLDIEDPSYWNANPSDNNLILYSFSVGFATAGVHWGVYTSNSQWSPITGDSTGLSGQPLWYASWGNGPSYSGLLVPSLDC